MFQHSERTRNSSCSVHFTSRFSSRRRKRWITKNFPKCSLYLKLKLCGDYRQWQDSFAGPFQEHFLPSHRRLLSDEDFGIKESAAVVIPSRWRFHSSPTYIGLRARLFFWTFPDESKNCGSRVPFRNRFLSMGRWGRGPMFFIFSQKISPRYADWLVRCSSPVRLSLKWNKIKPALSFSCSSNVFGGL